jgi:hypothetical protein
MSLPKKAPRRKALPKTTPPLPKTRARPRSLGTHPSDALPKTDNPLPNGKGRGPVVEKQFVGAEKIDGAAVVYQQERVTCGKPSCKSCRAGGGHGPYWYAYWTTFGRTRSIYIGKELRSVAETLDKRAKREAANV